MFWRKKSVAGEEQKSEVEKLPGPGGIPEVVGRYLVVQKRKDPDWVWNLKAVVRKRAGGKREFDVRVFDGAQAAAKKVKIKDYNSLNEHPDLILYEGWFDKKSMRVEIEGTTNSATVGGGDTTVSTAA